MFIGLQRAVNKA